MTSSLRRGLRWIAAALVLLGAPGLTEASSQPRTDAELDWRAEEILSRSEWRQLRRQAEDARQNERRRESWLERCEPEDKKERPAAEPRSGCDGCSGCSGCAGVGQGVSGLMSVLTGLLVAALLGFLLWALWKALAKKRDGEDAETEGVEVEGLLLETPPGERPASVYLREALALAAAGDYAGAIRQLLLGSMSWTERRGLIRFRRGLTNREYLRAVRSRPAQLQCMQEVVLAFEEVFFGRRPATRERFERVLPEYRAAFESDDPEPGAEDAALAPAG